MTQIQVNFLDDGDDYQRPRQPTDTVWDTDVGPDGSIVPTPILARDTHPSTGYYESSIAARAAIKAWEARQDAPDWGNFWEAVGTIEP